MIIKSITPSRISLFGGSTDISQFSDKYGGAIINFAINIYQHVTLYADEDKWQEPLNKFPAGVDPSLAFEILKAYDKSGLHNEISIVSSFDGHIGSGLGSSGAFSVALVAAMERLSNIPIDRLRIAERAYQIELRTKLTGRQDNYSASFGGLNLFLFGKKTKVILLPRQWIENLSPYMCLFYLGSPRRSRDIQQGFNELTDNQIETLTKIKETIKTALALFSKFDISGLGDLLQYSWELKKKSNNVSNNKIDEIYEHGLKNGALAGKILGSGQGGYFLFLAPPSKRQQLIETMKKKGIEEVDFSIDWNGVSSRIL